ncbi:protein FAR1-RELATED SEQUENCE 5-like [Salvia miltiorrhiza]|uniref:protein FAR1-RELATED SEQUENCE 5-like n=1 Tax=Salvia miltiorrhiza TaxID=226208 RepID=UPI0025AC1FEB|nr:protein FAR1-RELATED SEQUENCE 5-like [Salvia miltiorrhiza]
MDGVFSDQSSTSDRVFLPQCDDEFKPIVGNNFCSLDDGEKFYMAYAKRCGFKARLGPVKRKKSGVIISRLIFCSREGLSKSSGGGKIRSRMSTRVDCKARIILRVDHGGSYTIVDFIEAHSHGFVSDNLQHFMLSNRKLDHGHKKFVMNCVITNIGPVKSFYLFKKLVRGYDKVGCTTVDFKNFARDLRAYVLGSDAQILLNNLFNKREICSDFRFEYAVDSSDKLTRLFWADHLSIQKYDAFGESVSFDATYSTNRYNLIFVPFTGKDNHGRCVTFGAGLISHEDEESYSWVLEKFVECMRRRPMMIITDQDPALKKSVERILYDTRHRFCMWHIMVKVMDNVPHRLKTDLQFKKDFDRLAWSEFTEPLSFERRWNDLMEKYGLVGDKWFDSMFAQRSYWIPSFFRNCHMSGLFKTTSMSESQNSFFRSYFNRGANLIEFFIHFERAIEAQRNQCDRLNSVDVSCFSKLVTDLAIERHAATVYTSGMFVEVQKQIVSASFSCCILEIRTGVCENVYVVENGESGKFSVTYNLADYSCNCDCKYFVRCGWLCSHVFCVLKNVKIQRIPDQYILKRWTKGICVGGSTHSGGTDTLSQLYSLAYSCIGLVQGDSVKMEKLFQTLKGVHDSLSVNSSSSSNADLFNEFYGGAPPEVIDVHPPDIVKTKGSGSRLKSRIEKALRDKNKPKRRCGNCKEMVNHDARNCDQEPAVK